MTKYPWGIASNNYRITHTKYLLCFLYHISSFQSISDSICTNRTPGWRKFWKKFRRDTDIMALMTCAFSFLTPAWPGGWQRLFLPLCPPLPPVLSLYTDVVSARLSSWLQAAAGAPLQCRLLLCTRGFSSPSPSISMMSRSSGAGVPSWRGGWSRGRMRE